jgi:hypothetical protein
MDLEEYRQMTHEDQIAYQLGFALSLVDALEQSLRYSETTQADRFYYGGAIERCRIMSEIREGTM